MEKTVLVNGKAFTASDIQEKIWDLRNKQANCPSSERAQIQQWILKLQQIMDTLRS